MQKKKILTGFAITVALMASAFVLPAYAGVVDKSSTWDFSTVGATELSEDYEYNNLTIKATDASKVSFDDTQLKLMGKGSSEARCISFTVVSGCTIDVDCKSSSNTDARTLRVVNEDGTILKEITADVSYAVKSFEYTGIGENLYIYSSSGGINIKDMSITYDGKPLKGDVDDNTSIDEADAAKVLNHIVGVSQLDDNWTLSAANPNNDGVVDMLDVIWILSHKKDADEVTTESTTETTTIDTSDGEVVTDYDSLTAALKNSLNQKIYVTNDIDCSAQLSLNVGGQSLIGVPDENGALPVLDFTQAAGTGKPGIRIYSNNNTVKNLVVEHADDNGILIKGDRDNGIDYTDNTIENCILRYNNDSGLQITNSVYRTLVKNVYSYRNCDVATIGSNADGFAVKLGAGPSAVSSASDFQDDKNTFENCYSWDNSDDGWDSFDYAYGASKTEISNIHWTYKNEYINSMCWRNGSQSIHIGYTDYANGLQLDEELPVIRYMKSALSSDVYDSFVTAYNSGSLGKRTMTRTEYSAAVDKLTGVKISTESGDLTLTQYASDDYWGGNPNGFKLGSAYTQSISERTLRNCIAFDNHAEASSKKGSGIDKNNSKCNIELENVISFNNDINFHLDGYTAKNWSNAYGWSYQKSADDLPKKGVSATVTKPDAGTTATEKLVRAAADEIVDYASQNKFTTTNIFTTAFKG